jgi:hypothetical protein
MRYLYAMKTKGRAATTKPTRDDAPIVDPRFAPVVKAFAKDRGVVHGGNGKGFGSSGLKVNGKLFALMSSRGLFVAKLPRQRVEELARQGKGRPFDPGHGRLMKEWLEVDGDETSWPALAREARVFVGGAKSK